MPQEAEVVVASAEENALVSAPTDRDVAVRRVDGEEEREEDYEQGQGQRQGQEGMNDHSDEEDKERVKTRIYKE